MNLLKDKRASTTLMLVIMLSTLSLILLATQRFAVVNNMRVARMNEISQNSYNVRNGFERLHAVLNENPSFEGTLSFEDIGQEIIVEEVSISTSLIQESQNSTFRIVNKTPLVVNLTVYGSYDNPTSVNITGAGILNGLINTSFNASSVQNYNITITEDKFYNKINDYINYGQGGVFSNNTTRTSMTINRLIIDSRIIKVTNGNIVRRFEIQTTRSGDITINEV